VNASKYLPAQPSFGLAWGIVQRLQVANGAGSKYAITEDTMLAIEEWGVAKYKPIVMLAHVVSASAQECYEIILASRAASKLLPKDCGPDAWLRLYRQPLNVEAIVLSLLCSEVEPQLMSDTLSHWPRLRGEVMGVVEIKLRKRLTKWFTTGMPLRVIERCDRYMDRFYERYHLPQISSLLHDETARATQSPTWLYRPEFLFFMSVAMPCWLEYGKTPWELFQQARRGDFQAMENLIRLDPEVDKEQTLKGIVFRMSRQNPAQYKLLNKARAEGRKSPITLADVKFSLGSLLMKWSKEIQGIVRGELLFRSLEANTEAEYRNSMHKRIKAAREAAERTGIKCWLKAPDIKALFDAIAQDTGEGLADADFAGQPNSIYKRLERNAKMWPSLQETDISRAA
jgi:hypothetical protein